MEKTLKSKATSKRKKTPTKLSAVTPSRIEITQLAEKFWMERGKIDGAAEQDWLRAEAELHAVHS